MADGSDGLDGSDGMVIFRPEVNVNLVLKMLILVFPSHPCVHLADGLPVPLGALDAVAVHEGVDDVGYLDVMPEQSVKLFEERGAEKLPAGGDERRLTRGRKVVEGGRIESFERRDLHGKETRCVAGTVFAGCFPQKGVKNRAGSRAARKDHAPGLRIPEIVAKPLGEVVRSLDVDREL